MAISKLNRIQNTLTSLTCGLYNDFNGQQRCKHNCKQTIAHESPLQNGRFVVCCLLYFTYCVWESPFIILINSVYSSFIPYLCFCDSLSDCNLTRDFPSHFSVCNISCDLFHLILCGSHVGGRVKVEISLHKLVYVTFNVISSLHLLILMYF